MANTETLRKPEGLSTDGEKAYEIICGFLKTKGMAEAASPVFYPPMGSEKEAVLLVAHYGGAAEAFWEPESYRRHRGPVPFVALAAALDDEHFEARNRAGYSAIYRRAAPSWRECHPELAGLGR